MQLFAVLAHFVFLNNYLVLLIGGPKCALATSHDVPWRVTVSMPTATGQTDGQTRPELYITFFATRGQRHNGIGVVHTTKPFKYEVM